MNKKTKRISKSAALITAAAVAALGGIIAAIAKRRERDVDVEVEETYPEARIVSHASGAV